MTAVPPWRSIAAACEAMAKLAALAGLVLYAVGLVVTNTYLARFGLTDFATVKPQCVLVGCWTVLLLVLAAVPGIACLTVASELARGRVKRVLLSLVWLVVCGYFVSLFTGFIFTLFFIDTGGVDTNDVFGGVGAAIPSWPGLVLLMSGLPILFLWPQLIFGKGQPEPVAHWELAMLGVMVLPACIAVVVIGYDVFPRVNAEVGGGRATETLVQFSAEGRDIVDRARKISQPYHDGEPPLSVGADLVYASADRYLIRVVYCDSARRYRSLPVLLDKRMVQALYLSGGHAADPRRGCPYESPKH
jgi:hypothetical protein